MKKKICCFMSGVSVKNYEMLDNLMFTEIENLINNGYNIFYCEFYGEFAKICKDIIKEFKLELPFVKLVVVNHIEKEIIEKSKKVYCCSDMGINILTLELLQKFIVNHKDITFVDSYFGIKKL